MILRLEEISKQYRNKKILNSLSLAFPQGKISALAGANGAGKSSLLKIAVALLKPDRGRVILRNRDIGKLPPWRRIKAGLGYLSQENSLIQELSVEDNIYLVPQGAGENAEGASSRSEEFRFRESLLRQFGLDTLRKQKCKNLSGGEARKVELCRCMATRPLCALLDEPFAGLDPKTIRILLNMIRNQNQKGISFVIADHRIEELKKVAERYFLLEKGRLIFQGDSRDFFSNKEVESCFLGDMSEEKTKRQGEQQEQSGREDI